MSRNERDEMDVQTELDVAAAIRRIDGNHDLGASQLAEDLLAELADQGYALVKLPSMVVDELDMATWPVDGDSEGRPRAQVEDDGRISILSTPNPLRSADQAWSLAAALIAAARHVTQEKRDG